jgi:hypothetical protein
VSRLATDQFSVAEPSNSIGSTRRSPRHSGSSRRQSSSALGGLFAKIDIDRLRIAGLDEGVQPHNADATPRGRAAQEARTAEDWVHRAASHDALVMKTCGAS